MRAHGTFEVRLKPAASDPAQGKHFYDFDYTLEPQPSTPNLA